MFGGLSSVQSLCLLIIVKGSFYPTFFVDHVHRRIPWNSYDLRTQPVFHGSVRRVLNTAHLLVSSPANQQLSMGCHGMLWGWPIDLQFETC